MPAPNMFSRDFQLRQLRETPTWDIIVIGGGATGLGIAVDAGSRGLKTLLLEQHDFAKGTSSRSTKLIHGGVRYLAQGDLKLVYGALRERNFLSRNAAHVVKPQSFVIPCYSKWELLKYAAGLKVYDMLAGRYGLGRSRILGKKEVLHLLPKITSSGLQGGIEYFDGRFDDARLAINLAQSAIENSATVMNYFKVTGLIKEAQKLVGVAATDQETGVEYSIRASVVVNATGVFVDDIIKFDEPAAVAMVTPSQGVHLVIAKKFFEGKSALLIPETSDGRVLFAVPWHDHVVVGTTDTPLKKSSLEPVAARDEIGFILANLQKFLPVAPQEKDVLSVFAGLRPLAAVIEKTDRVQTKELSRDHKIFTSPSGLITITGGKWTTYRKMAEVTVDTAMELAGMQKKECTTSRLRLHGCTAIPAERFSDYGNDAPAILALTQTDERYGALLTNTHPYTVGEVVWAARYEMARTVEDVLARRTRLLFIDARAAIDCAPKVAAVLREELGLSEAEVEKQLEEFYFTASHYILKS